MITLRKSCFTLVLLYDVRRLLTLHLSCGAVAARCSCCLQQPSCWTSSAACDNYIDAKQCHVRGEPSRQLITPAVCHIGTAPEKNELQQTWG